MPVHQIPHRTVLFEGKAFPAFPANVEVHAKLVPEELFGESDLTGKLHVRPGGQQVTFGADLVHGGIKVGTGGRLPRFRVETVFFDLGLRVDGGLATVAGTISSDASFQKLIHLMANNLPSFLSCALHEPVEIARLFGKVEEQAFRVEVRGEYAHLLRTVDSPRAIGQTMERLQKLPDAAAQRILAALRYLNQARWLEYVAPSPNQFAGERLLNLSKALEVTFACSGSVEELRDELRALGIQKDAVELIASTIYVRNQVDVGHCKLHLLSPGALVDFHTLVRNSAEVIEWLIGHVVEELGAERYVLPSAPLDDTSDRTMTRVAEVVQKVTPCDANDYLDLSRVPPRQTAEGDEEAS